MGRTVRNSVTPPGFEHEPPSTESAKPCKSSSSRKQALKMAAAAAAEISGASDDVAVISADEAKESPSPFSTTPATSEVQSVSPIPSESQLFYFPKPSEDLKPSPAQLTPVPVGPCAKGTGLPYAPEGFPCPEDKWTWRVSKRRNSWGFWERYLSPPARLQQKRKHVLFTSKTALEKYMREYFPQEDLEKFYASFIWQIPCAPETEKSDYSPREMRITRSKRPRESDVDRRAHVIRACKAGNVKCCLESGKGKFPKAMECDICCTELGFCRECSCILCGKPIDHDLEHHFIQCQGKMSEDFICGHVAHLECAVKCKRGGVVREHSLTLDVEYFCMRCDNKTDLLRHVLGLITVPGPGKLKSDIESSLKLASKLVDGTEQMGCRSIENLIKKALKKLESGMEVHDIFGDVQDSSVTVNAGEVTCQGEKQNWVGKDIHCLVEAMAQVTQALPKVDGGDAQHGEARMVIHKHQGTQTNAPWGDVEFSINVSQVQTILETLFNYTLPIDGSEFPELKLHSEYPFTTIFGPAIRAKEMLVKQDQRIIDMEEKLRSCERTIQAQESQIQDLQDCIEDMPLRLNMLQRRFLEQQSCISLTTRSKPKENNEPAINDSSFRA